MPKTWLFAASLLLLVTGLKAQIPGSCNFVRYDNTNIYGGMINPATSESSCQDACRATQGCQGIDWSTTNSAGQQCFIHNKATDKNSNIIGVTHYDYICNGSTGPSMPLPPSPTSGCKACIEVYPDTNSMGGYNVPEIRDVLGCNAACQKITPCLGFDFSQSTGCWLHYDPTSFSRKYYQQGVTQFKFNRCPEEGISSCTASYNNGVLTSTCNTACYPKWMRFDNTAGSGGMVVTTVGQKNFSACLEYCFDSSDCVGVDYSDAPGNASVCSYYPSSQTSAMNNVMTKAYVTQYRLVNRCWLYCTTNYEQRDNYRYRLFNSVSYGITSQTDCERQCRMSQTCQAYQFTKSGPASPSCSLADDYYIGSEVMDSTVYTGLFKENCNKTKPPPTPPVPGSCNFVRYDNTNIYGGVINPATSESSCQDACRATQGCQGIDWSTTNSAGQQCFLLTKTTDKNSNIIGVTHYDYICNGSSIITTSGIVIDISTTSSPPGSCYWSTYYNSQILGGNQTAADNVDACMRACLYRPGCVSIDFTPTNPSGSRCYLLATSSDRVPSQSGTTHYDYVCPNNACWQRYPDTLIYGGQVNSATSLTDCWKACVDRGKQACTSIDWSKTNSPGWQCFLLSTQLGKTMNQPGVDHYDLIC